ncbi:spore germination protein (amino acid permease) [Bacillus thermophilus]|uniref:Spore germination protein (Amino acid permease) n=1 Tax=Siminovitchia thermophila TaxID=1245522 RepID=A0ABS2RCW3_9BACI|nr:GerAB/ArcD/ProY family transporter [Siminovitchia thermophila]MBM7717419.1 spore germination protein (amino acid permease) [Siminovitchia thermophila]
MIKATDGKLGTRELFSIIFLMLAIKVTDTTPSIFLNTGINAGWMLPIFSFLFFLIPFLLLLGLFRKHQVGLIEMANKLTGKFFGGVITFIFISLSMATTVINTRSYADIVITMYYPHTSVFMILLVAMATCLLVAIRGLETIGSTAWLITPAILVSAVLLIIFVTKDLEPGFIFPIAGPGMWDLIKGGISYSSFLGGDIIILFLLAPFVRTYKSFQKASIWSFSVSSAKMVIFMAAFIMMFDYPSVESIAYPYHHLTRLAAVGALSNHVEAIFLGLWFMGAAVRFAIYIYICAFLLGKLIRFNEFERLLLPLTGLIILLALMPDNYFQGFEARKLLLKIGSGFFFSLPVLLWGIDRFKGRKKK